MSVIGFLRLFFYLVFIIFNVMTYYLVDEVENNKKCICRDDEYITKAYNFLNTIEYIKTFSLLSCVIGLINLFIPFNKGILNIMVIGSFISIILFILLLGQAFALSRFVNFIKTEKCIKTCKLSTFYNNFSDFIIAGSLVSYIVVIVLVLFGLKY